jgi:hypothetical protein
MMTDRKVDGQSCRNHMDGVAVWYVSPYASPDTLCHAKVDDAE